MGGQINAHDWGANAKDFWQVKANDPASGLVGAYVSTTAAGVNIPAGTNLLAAIDLNGLEYVLITQVTPTTTPTISVNFTAYYRERLRRLTEQA